MKKLKFLTIFLSLCLLAALLPGSKARALAGPDVTSRAAIVLDRATGEVLWSKNEETAIYPASTTKIMTVLLAVEAVESGTVALSDQVTVSDTATFDLIADGSTAGIQVGETMPLEDLLYCAMLASANEACNIIAEHIAGSVPAFVAQMNRRAEDLGCTDTHFANTNGLPDENHRTTAADMGRIALEASRHPMFMEICGTKTKEIAATNLSGVRALKNSNALINDQATYGSGYLYERASGMKTGYTNDAGYCLVSTAEDADSGIELLAGVFGGVHDENGYSNFADTITLLDWVFDNFSYQEVLDPGVSVASVDVSLGKDSDYVNLRPAGAITLLLPNDYDRGQFTLDMQVYSLQQGEAVTAPVTAGEVLGEVSVLRDGQNCGTVKLVAASSVDLSRGQYIRTHLRETIHTGTFRLIFWSAVLILVLYLAWVILYRVRRIKYRRAVQAARGGAHVRGRADAAPAPELPAEPEIEFFSDDGVPDLYGRHSARLPVPETEDTRAVSISEEPTAPKPGPPDDSAQFGNKAGRDYFEEFFRQK